MSENKYKYILHVKSSLPDIYENRYHAASITNVESGLSVEFLTDTETNLKHRLNHAFEGQYYVSKPGSRKSYTTDINNARKFTDIEQAERERCDNERIVKLSLVGYAEA